MLNWHCCIFSAKLVISVDISVKSVEFDFYQFQYLPKLNMMCIVRDWTWRTKVWKFRQSSLTLWSLGKSSIKQPGQLCSGSGEHLNVISNNLFHLAVLKGHVRFWLNSWRLESRNSDFTLEWSNILNNVTWFDITVELRFWKTEDKVDEASNIWWGSKHFFYLFAVEYYFVLYWNGPKCSPNSSSITGDIRKVMVTIEAAWEKKS